MYCETYKKECPLSIGEFKVDIKHLSHKFSKRGRKIEYIVIHDTGNFSEGADAMAHYNYFEKSKVKASANFVVDDKRIIELIDPKYSSWHCGDGRGKNGIWNSNSIGIEMCVNINSDFQAMLKNTLMLTKSLMKEFNIPPERVVRHYDASGKICPRTMSFNDWEMWKKFKELL